MTHIRYVWYVLLFTIFLPNLLHAQVRGEEKVVFDFDCPTIKHKVIGMIYKDDIPFDDKRTDIGVGEEVLLMIDSKFGNIVWTVTPTTAGSIIPKGSTSKVEFHASLDATTAIIRATPEITCSANPFVEVSLQIIAPILNFPKYCNMHLKDVIDAGMYTRVSLLPDNVSFHNISIFEKDCIPESTTGILNTPKLKMLSHNTMPNWVGFHELGTLQHSDIYTGEGSLMYSGDRAQLILGNSTTIMPSMQTGTLTWNILTDFAKHDNKSDVRVLNPSPMVQEHTIDSNGVTYSRVTKGTNSYQIDRIAKNNLCSHCECPPY